ncbi:hypothetical protein [Urechidicola croceus]|uniref:DNA topoisomerase IV n=1 Tax=Urechidicola croceus TaxID=1850246 RepID=A0A1D8P602_9FLAO|nr:hypothetical protein [Urechidicola croceus]AOW20001.1 hypothetical protein LPB138_04575 [Urechidicola croceus]
MKNIIILVIGVALLVSCKRDSKVNIENFRTGKFEIPAGDKFEKTIFTRNDSLQIEIYEDRIDSLSIKWKNNFNYTLRMLNPITELDKEPINVKITGITSTSYDFEAIIGHSNYKQEGTVYKIE